MRGKNNNNLNLSNNERINHFFLRNERINHSLVVSE